MKILNPSILKKLNLPPVGQVGIIVEDLKTAVPQYSSLLTRFAYYDSMEELGYITELIQTTLFGITIGMPGWMMRIGCLIGDVNLIK
jgi:hypothetical protein